MRINNYGDVFLEEEEIFEHIYSGELKNVAKIYTTENLTSKFNSSQNLNKDIFDGLTLYKKPTISEQEYDRLNQTNWFMPTNYCTTLIEDIYKLCKTEQEIERVNIELELFQKHNMIDLLFYLKYLVDVMKENNVLCGVGRGSSVASYVLYLIGVHKINSIKYDLDIREFLK